MVEREIPYGRAPTGPLLNSRACLRILSLSVEHLKVLMVEREIDGGDGGPLPYGRAINPLWSSEKSLMVEPLPVLSLTVEPACASSPYQSST